jgi:hypothetical protein
MLCIGVKLPCFFCFDTSQLCCGLNGLEGDTRLRIPQNVRKILDTKGKGIVIIVAILLIVYALKNLGRKNE